MLLLARSRRPLRTIQRSPSMQRITQAMLSALPGALVVFALCMIYIAIFGIVMVHLFGGRQAPPSSCLCSPFLLVPVLPLPPRACALL